MPPSPTLMSALGMGTIFKVSFASVMISMESAFLANAQEIALWKLVLQNRDYEEDEQEDLNARSLFHVHESSTRQPFFVRRWAPEVGSLSSLSHTFLCRDAEAVPQYSTGY